MSYLLPHLDNGWYVDQAILSEGYKLVVIRFGHDWHPSCMQMDEMMYKMAYKLSKFVVFYLVDIGKVPDFNIMNRHIMIDTGTGNNNKINWVLKETQDLIDICYIVYKGAKKGKGLVVADRDYSVKRKY